MPHPIARPRWWAAAAVRALKTFAQVLVALAGTSVLITDVPWEAALSGAGLAAVLSLLTSLGGLPEVEDDAS